MSHPQSVRPTELPEPPTEIGPDPAPRRPLWQIGRRVTVSMACMSFGALGACSFSLGAQTVEEASDIEVGECLQIGAEAGEGKVKATKQKCEGTDGLTFYAASKVDASAECTADHTSSLTFADGDKKLCLTPNFASGSCYQIPVNGGKLVDYREVGCDATPVENTVIARAVDRGDDSITCTAGQITWTFAQPISLGYCLSEDVSAADRFGG